MTKAEKAAAENNIDDATGTSTDNQHDVAVPKAFMPTLLCTTSGCRFQSRKNGWGNNSFIVQTEPTVAESVGGDDILNVERAYEQAAGLPSHSFNLPRSCQHHYDGKLVPGKVERLLASLNVKTLFVTWHPDKPLGGGGKGKGGRSPSCARTIGE